MSQIKKTVKKNILFISALLSFILILKFIKMPLLFIIFEILLILILVILKRNLLIYFKVIFWGLTTIFLMLDTSEVFFSAKNFEIKERTFKVICSGDKEVVRDKLRGYSSVEGKARVKKTVKGKVVYDVTYTKNKFGLRVTPHDIRPVQLNPDFKNIIFFGCSLTYGEGVADDENLPFIFEEKSQGRYKAYNFGFHGYGPQHMLRILKSDIIDTIIPDRQPSIAVYQAIPDHISRCAFKYPANLWYKGPICKLDKSGNIIFGNSEGQQSWIKRQLLKSYLFRRFYYRLKKDDIRLFLKVIQKSKEIFVRKYKGEFYVLYWDDDSPISREVLKELRKEHIKVFLVSQILAGRDKDKGFREKYRIKGDRHPNKVAYKRLAEYLLNNLEFKK